MTDTTQQLIRKARRVQAERDKIIKRRYLALTKAGMGQNQATQAIAEHLMAKGDFSITTAAGVRRALIRLGIINQH